MYKTSYILPRITDSPLEFRTLLCIARITQTVLSKFPYRSINELEHQLLQMDDPSSQKDKLKWTIGHLLLGEMQSLDTLKQIAFGQIRQQPHFIQMMDTTKKRPTEYTMRNQPCPYDKVLLNRLLESE